MSGCATGHDEVLPQIQARFTYWGSSCMFPLHPVGAETPVRERVWRGDGDSFYREYT
jgi:hypothetical protein